MQAHISSPEPQPPPISASVTPLLQRPDFAALAHLYWSPPNNHVVREELLERARLALGKYDLEQDELDEATPVLAAALHMLMEQNGGKELPREYQRDVERRVMDWVGCNTRHPDT